MAIHSNASDVGYSGTLGCDERGKLLSLGRFMFSGS